ncbi:MAG: hypothetical protein PVH41_17130 [Anaerolineae bacterium]|jgi:hypothetical protein
MKAEYAYSHCRDQLRSTLGREIGEVESVVAAVEWASSIHFIDTGKVYEHQTG